MKTTYKNFVISESFIGDKVSPWDERNDNYHKVTVKNLDNGKKTSFDFWCSIVQPTFKTEYDLLNAFYCFLCDAIDGTMSFEDFCSEFGYDTDSRRDERIWKNCKRSFNKFWNLTGYSLDMMYDFINELSEIAG